jgi:membrane protein DedA with SNARE-associated domain
MISADNMLPLLLQYGLLIAIALILIGQIGVPIGAPAELVLLLAGGYAVRSMEGLIGGVLLVGMADILGSLVLFLLVRRGVSGLAARLTRARDGRKTWFFQDTLRRRGPIFLVRVLPLMRIYGTVGAGLHRARTRDFLAGTAPAGFLWTGTPLVLGYVLRGHVSAVVDRYPTGIISMVAVVPGLLLTALMFARSRRRAQGTATPVTSVPHPAARRVVRSVAWLADSPAVPTPALQPQAVVAANIGALPGPARSVPPYP